MNTNLANASDFLSHSSCFREIALSERACAGDYHSIMSAVAGADSSSSSSLAALCWSVSHHFIGHCIVDYLSLCSAAT